MVSENVGRSRGMESVKARVNSLLFIPSSSCTNSPSGVCFLSSNSYILERVTARTFVAPGVC